MSVLAQTPPPSLVILAAAFLAALALAILFCGRWRALRRHQHTLEERLADRDRRLTVAASDVDGVRSQLARQERLATLGFLLTGIAHELNTPAAAVDSMYDTVRRVHEKLDGLLLREEIRPEDLAEIRRLVRSSRDADGVIDNGLARLRELIRNLRSAARGDSPVPELYDVNAGLESALLLLHNELKHDIEVVREFGEIPPIRAVALQINQVFLNLILNARQAIKGRGRIRVATRREGDGVQITVEDDGHGIAEPDLARIFEPDFTTKPLNEGTGLGLAICRIVCASHGGRIEASSREGAGATFVVWLPAEPPREPRSAARPGEGGVTGDARG